MGATHLAEATSANHSVLCWLSRDGFFVVAEFPSLKKCA